MRAVAACFFAVASAAAASNTPLKGTSASTTTSSAANDAASASTSDNPLASLDASCHNCFLVLITGLLRQWQSTRDFYRAQYCERGWRISFAAEAVVTKDRYTPISAKVEPQAIRKFLGSCLDRATALAMEGNTNRILYATGIGQLLRHPRGNAVRVDFIRPNGCHRRAIVEPAPAATALTPLDRRVVRLRTPAPDNMTPNEKALWDLTQPQAGRPQDLPRYGQRGDPV